MSAWLAVGAVLVAAVLELLLAEPPRRVHPIAIFGRAVAVVDRDWRRPTVAGVLLAVVMPLVFAAAAWLLLTGVAELGAARSPVERAVAVTVVAGCGLFSLTSLSMLVGSGREVIEASVVDVERAKHAVIALVGRDPAALSPAQLRSAALESMAENLADGLVAPLGAFVCGAQWSLALGVGAAAWVKAVNTLDSMVGYPDRRLGTASARLDDLVMWLPARIAALLVVIGAGSIRTLGEIRGGASVPASPNSGWPMAALACALEVRLEKPAAYVLNPGADLPTPSEARAGARVITVAGALAGAAAVALLGVGL